MKIKHFFLAAICLLTTNMLFTSCDSDNDDFINDDGSKIELPNKRAFILNEGLYQQNNANITFYNSNDNKIIKDIFKAQNGANLGDTSQDMIEYNGYIYVTINGSNYLTKLNSAGVVQKSISFAGDAILGGGIRYITAEDGFIYASFYGGVVAKINANTLEIVNTLQNIGSNLEGVSIANDNLYVANSFKMTGASCEYLNEVIVIDLNSFTVKERITVSTTPNQVIEEDDKIFVISWGNYYDKGYSFQMIDPKQNNKVTELGVATKMASGNDMVYLVNSDTDWSINKTTNTFFSYNVKTGIMNNSSFLKNAPEELASSTIYMISIDDESGDIYVGVTFFEAGDGTIYRFAKDGTYINKFDCGGISPLKMVFFN